MAIQTGHPEASFETVGRFEHTTEGHELEDVVFARWTERAIPVTRATVLEDENEGWDFRIGPVRVDITMDQEKFEKDQAVLSKNLQNPHIQAGIITAARRGYPLPAEVIVPVKVGKRDPVLVRTDQKIQEEIANEAWSRFINQLKFNFDPQLAKTLMGNILREMQENPEQRKRRVQQVA